MVHQEQQNDGKASFQPFLQFKRSSKSHPRTDSISSFSSGISRSRSTGRDPRMLDLMKTYKTGNNREDDVQSVSSQASSMLSSWSGMGSSYHSDVTQHTSFPRERLIPERTFTPIHEDENDAVSVSSSVPSVMSLTSLQSGLSSWRPLSPEVGCKRKFSSIAEAISDSDEDMEDRLVAKRPRTPLPNSLKVVGILEIFKLWVWKLLKSLVTIVIVMSALFIFVLCFTFYKNYQCTQQKSLTINTTLVMEKLTRNLISQELGVKEIMKSLAKFSSLTSEDTGPSTLLLLLFGWVGVGKTLAARLLSHSLPTLHNTQFLSCSLLAEDTINTVMDRLILGCGYSLLVLDDCDLGDQNVLRLIRNLANDVTDRPDVKSSGVIIILTTSDGGKILNKLVAERIRDRGQISGISAEDVNSALRREDPKHVSFREQVAAPKFLLRSVPFLPLSSESVAQCAQRAARDQGVTLSSAQLGAVMEMQQFAVIKNVKIANTGCKQIASRIDIVLAGASGTRSPNPEL